MFLFYKIQSKNVLFQTTPRDSMITRPLMSRGHDLNTKITLLILRDHVPEDRERLESTFVSREVSWIQGD